MRRPPLVGEMQRGGRFHRTAHMRYRHILIFFWVQERNERCPFFYVCMDRQRRAKS